MTNIQTHPKHHTPARSSLFGWPDFFEPFRQVGSAVANLFSPDADASHDDDAYRIRVELPGVAEDDVDVSLHDDILTITGEKKEERTEKDEDRRLYFTERAYGSFQRSFRVPENVQQDKIKAEFDKGVLTLTLPKREEPKTEKKTIKVTSK